MSENLLPREAFETPRAPRIWLFAAVIGGLFGAVFWIVFSAIGVLFFLIVGQTYQISAFLRFNSALGTLCGVGFFAFVYVATRRKNPRNPSNLTSLIDQIYFRDPSIAPPPADDAKFKYRIPATYVKTPKVAVGGIVYLGKSGLMFLPHQKNGPSDLESIRIEPLSDLQLKVIPRRVNVRQRLLVARVDPLLQVLSSALNAEFLVPRPEQTRKILEAAIVELLDG
jgi:hypothetical protein